jgi:hypothetical protein
MLDVITLNVVMPSVVAPKKQFRLFWVVISDREKKVL